jgi:hypothetical protein
MDSPISPTPPQRLTSLGAYCGFVMFLRMAGVLRFGRVSSSLNVPDEPAALK